MPCQRNLISKNGANEIGTNDKSFWGKATFRNGRAYTGNITSMYSMLEQNSVLNERVCVHSHLAFSESSELQFNLLCLVKTFQCKLRRFY